MSLALELRPKTLDEVVGQEHIKPTIRKDIERGCQRWLFHGPTGTGKTSLAHIVARELGTEEADVLEFNAAELGTKDIRAIVEQTKCYPMYGSKHRVIILDEAQALSDEAKSVLLKPLENDADHINVWILCTMDVDELHRALRDRCKGFKLNKMGREQRRELVDRAAKHLHYTEDTKPFLREIDAKELYSARDIFVSFEKFADGMKVEDALA